MHCANVCHRHLTLTQVCRSVIVMSFFLSSLCNIHSSLIRTSRLSSSNKDESQIATTRYFLCKANMPVGYIARLLRLKFNIDPTAYKVCFQSVFIAQFLFNIFWNIMQVGIYCNGHLLLPEMELGEVAHIYSWNMVYILCF